MADSCEGAPRCCPTVPRPRSAVRDDDPPLPPQYHVQAPCRPDEEVPDEFTYPPMRFAADEPTDCAQAQDDGVVKHFLSLAECLAALLEHCSAGCVPEQTGREVIDLDDAGEAEELPMPRAVECEVLPVLPRDAVEQLEVPPVRGDEDEECAGVGACISVCGSAPCPGAGEAGSLGRHVRTVAGGPMVCGEWGPCGQGLVVIIVSPYGVHCDSGVTGVVPACYDPPDVPARMVRKVYQVADLVAPPSCVDDVIRVITRTVAPATWCHAGGPAGVEYFPLGRCLVICQTEDVHEQIRQLLDELRQMAAEQVRQGVGPSCEPGDPLNEVPGEYGESIRKEPTTPEQLPYCDNPWQGADGQPQQTLPYDEPPTPEDLPVCDQPDDRSHNPPADTYHHEPSCPYHHGQCTRYQGCYRYSDPSRYLPVEEPEEVDLVDDSEMGDWQADDWNAHLTGRVQAGVVPEGYPADYDEDIHGVVEDGYAERVGGGLNGCMGAGSCPDEEFGVEIDLPMRHGRTFDIGIDIPLVRCFFGSRIDCTLEIGLDGTACPVPDSGLCGCALVEVVNGCPDGDAAPDSTIEFDWYWYNEPLSLGPAVDFPSPRSCS
jgi:hypothetical protein